MAIKDVIKVLEQFDPDQQLICQVIGNKAGAWNMRLDIQKPRDVNFVVFTMSHPELDYLPTNCAQPVTLYQCEKGHQFMGLPDHPAVMGRMVCPHCAARNGVIVP